MIAARDPDLVSPARAALWGLATFALVAAGGTFALAEEVEAPKVDVVVVIDCVVEQDACAALAAMEEP